MRGYRHVWTGRFHPGGVRTLVGSRRDVSLVPRMGKGVQNKHGLVPGSIEYSLVTQPTNHGDLPVDVVLIIELFDGQQFPDILAMHLVIRPDGVYR